MQRLGLAAACVVLASASACSRGPDDVVDASATTTTAPRLAPTTTAPTSSSSTTPTTIASTTIASTTIAPSTTTTVAVSTTAAPALDLLPTLVEGDSGPEVVLLQRMLNNVTGTTLAPDGLFGSDTTQAVTNFQAYVGIPATGQADHETRARLVELDGGRSTALPRWPVPSIGNGGGDGCQAAVVGDSLMAGAARLHQDALARIGCASAVDGVGGRSLSYGWQCRIHEPGGRSILRLLPEPDPGNESCAPSGLELLALWSRSGSLGDLVVVALGTNDAGIYTSEATWISHWTEALRLTGQRPVVFLTTRARPGSNRTPSQDAYSAALRRWCDTQPRCRVADWALTDVAGDVFSYVDSVHLRSTATEARAVFIAESVRALFLEPPGPNPAPLPTTTTSTSTTTTSSTTTSTAPTATSTSTTSSTTSTSTSSTTSTSTTTTTTTTTTSTSTTTTSTTSSTSSTTTTTAPP